MKPSPVDYFAEMDEQSSAMMAIEAMEVDGVDTLEIFGEGGPLTVDHKLTDVDFFNSFEDDFDDSDIN